MIEIEKLKQKHGLTSLNRIEVEDEDGNVDAVGYLKEPTLDNMDLFGYTMKAENEFVAMRQLFNLLWLDGDKKMLDDEGTFQAAIQQLGDVIKGNEIKYKKDDLKVVFVLTDDEGKEYTCTVRRPRLEEFAIITDKNPIKSFVKLLNKIWLSGDDECITDIKNIMSLNMSLGEAMKARASSVKKV